VIDSIGEICTALQHRWEPQKLFMIFTAYIDEADTHGPEPTVIMAGYAGHAYQWRRFEKHLSGIQKDLKFNIFHAKDFKARAGEFSGWTDEKCAILIEKISECLCNDLTQGFTAALTRARYLEEYRSEPIPKKMHLDSQYGATFRLCLAHLLHLMERRGNRDAMHVVIESGHPNCGDCIRIFKDIKSKCERLKIYVLGDITFKDKESCKPLMVADLLAAVHSMLRRGEARGDLNRANYTIKKGDKPIKGAFAVLDLAPGALVALKEGFEAERMKGIELWRAGKRQIEISR
jgi:hypothetical protein